MSEARALTNLAGNGMATIVVGKWCGEVDEARLHRELDREITAEAELLPPLDEAPQEQNPSGRPTGGC